MPNPNPNPRSDPHPQNSTSTGTYYPQSCSGILPLVLLGYLIPGPDSIRFVELIGEFQPHFVFISAGFDAHIEDPLGGTRARVRARARAEAGARARARVSAGELGMGDPYIVLQLHSAVSSLYSQYASRLRIYLLIDMLFVNHPGPSPDASISRAPACLTPPTTSPTTPWPVRVPLWACFSLPLPLRPSSTLALARRPPPTLATTVTVTLAHPRRQTGHRGLSLGHPTADQACCPRRKPNPSANVVPSLFLTLALTLFTSIGVPIQPTHLPPLHL